MSTPDQPPGQTGAPLTPAECEEIRRRKRAAFEEVVALSQGRRFRTSIPVRPGDSDQLLCAPLNDVDRLLDAVAALRAERDDADRRAGAAARRLAPMEESARREAHWLLAAKEEAGYHQNVSFDVVWAETLGKARQLEAVERERDRLARVVDGWAVHHDCCEWSHYTGVGCTCGLDEALAEGAPSSAPAPSSPEMGSVPSTPGDVTDAD